MKLTYKPGITDEEFKEATSALERALLTKDTPEEWARFTGQALLFVGKIAMSQIGLGPVIDLAEDVFGDDAELITKLLKMLEEKNNEDV